MNNGELKVHYRGRLAPSPTGLLHLGHASTFWTAYRRAREHGGALVLRNEDLDPQRSKSEYVSAMIEDMKWLGIEWDEGPDTGGTYAPYSQSERRDFYLAAWRKLRDSGVIFPCTCSRKDLAQAPSAPHESTDDTGASTRNDDGLANAPDDEPIYPGRCRCRIPEASNYDNPAGVNWRFRVPIGETIGFTDRRQGRQMFVAGRDFGDFLVWRRDDVPAYQLAVVVDDNAMRINEVVRGSDLLRSTARQILLLRALNLPIPEYYHCDLLRDEKGVRLAKRHDALSLRHLREIGCSPQELIARFV